MSTPPLPHDEIRDLLEELRRHNKVDLTKIIAVGIAVLTMIAGVMLWYANVRGEYVTLSNKVIELEREQQEAANRINLNSSAVSEVRSDARALSAQRAAQMEAILTRLGRIEEKLDGPRKRR